MTRFLIAIRMVWALAVCLILAIPLSAQETGGTLAGEVRDESGAVIPGVSITLRNTETGLTRSTVTDDQGHYRLPQLPPGSYQATAELPGFQTTVLRGIVLRIAQEDVVNVTLKVGEVREQVVVSAEVPLVETTSANVGAVVDEKTIRELPLNGRDFVQLAALQEGVVNPTSGNRSRTGDSGVKITIGGTRPNQTAILLDGSDIKNFYGGTPGGVSGSLLGVDTVREFRVITNAYSAEYGRFTGGVITAITRSGTNEIHGTVYEFLRNSALDARNFFDPGNAPPFKRNQFGFTLGGPIRKDHTFYFGSYEGYRQRLTTSQIAIFPNEAAHRGILPGQAPIAVPANIRPYLDLYPLPNGRDNGDGTGQFFFANSQPTDEDYFVVKLDHQFTPSDSFFVRYTLDDSSKSALNEGYVYGIASKSRNQYVTIEEKRIFSPKLLNEARFAYNRSTASDDDFENVPIPRSLWFRSDRRAMGLITFSAAINQFGTTTRTPQEFAQNLFQYMDNMIWSGSRHALKFGVAFDRFQFNLVNLARLNGTFTFRSLADFLRSNPNSATLFVNDPFRAGMRQSMIGFYVQDDYRVGSRLTLNLGLRYEAITLPVEVAGRIANIESPFQAQPRLGNPYFLNNPSLKDFSPRLGFAVDPTGGGKSSVRGGFGLFYDHILPWVYTIGPQRMKPFAVQASLESPRRITFPDSLRTLTLDDPGALAPNVLVVTKPNQAYIMQWNLSLQRELMGGTAVTATYSGSRGVHLGRIVDANTPLGTVVNGQRFFPPGSSRHNAGYATITTRFWDASSYFNGLKLGLRKRYSAGFQYQVSYQWQKFMDDGSNIGGSPGDFQTSNVSSVDWLNARRDRALSAYHTAHSFITNWGVELPFGPGRRLGANLKGVAARLVEGWELDGIAQWASGAPVNIEGDGLITCDFCGSRPNLVPGKSNNPQTGSIDHWFDISAFQNQPAGFYGNLGRNTGIGPGLATLDLAIHKVARISEGRSLQFRAEFFNILNHANFSAPIRTRTAFARGSAVGSFGQILSTTTTSRQIQFGLKVLF